MSSAATDVKKYKEALLRAARENDPVALKPFLEQAGLQWEDVRNSEKQHVLHVAAMEGADDAVGMLVGYSKVACKINSTDRNGRAPLHLAAAMGFEPTVRTLVRAKAELDPQDDKGCTPLHLAVKFDWVDTVRALLELGANPLWQDVRGETAASLSIRKPYDDMADMMDGYAGPRPQPSAMQDLRRCTFPRWIGAAPATPTRSGARPPGGAKGFVGKDDGCGVGKLCDEENGHFPEAEIIGTGFRSVEAKTKQQQSGPKREANEGNLCTAISEARKRTGNEGEDDSVIEWRGLEPVLVKKGGSSTASTASGSPAACSVKSSGEASSAKSSGGADGGWWRRAVEEHHGGEGPAGAGKAGAQAKPKSAAAAAWAGAPAGSKGTPAKRRASKEMGTVRLHLFFDDQVPRLEFEVEWGDSSPSAGTVKPNGAAARRGLVRGDRIVEIANKRTSGRGRDALLPLLKQRPLVLKVDREAALDVDEEEEEEAHAELELDLEIGACFDSTGIEVAMKGQLPVAAKVHPQSKAWAAGVLDGDALVRADGRDISRCSCADAEAAIEGCRTLHVWRRPLSE